MNLSKPSGAKGFPGANQVVQQTNQVVGTTPNIGLSRTLFSTSICKLAIDNLDQHTHVEWLLFMGIMNFMISTPCTHWYSIRIATCYTYTWIITNTGISPNISLEHSILAIWAAIHCTYNSRLHVCAWRSQEYWVWLCYLHLVTQHV